MKIPFLAFGLDEVDLHSEISKRIAKGGFNRSRLKILSQAFVCSELQRDLFYKETFQSFQVLNIHNVAEFDITF